jgi:hypothetical protein
MCRVLAFDDVIADESEVVADEALAPEANSYGEFSVVAVSEPDHILVAGVR